MVAQQHETYLSIHIQFIIRAYIFLNRIYLINHHPSNYLAYICTHNNDNSLVYIQRKKIESRGFSKIYVKRLMIRI